MPFRFERLLKAQQTLHGFSRRAVEDMTSPSHSNIWISPKSKHIKEELPNEEYSRLSDEMLARLGQLNAKGEFTITSAKGKGEWGPEPSFMLTDVPNHLHDDIHRLADEYEQDSVAVSGAGDKGAQFVKPDGKVTDEFGGMEFQENPEFSTDYPSGQRLAFTDWSDPVQTGEPMDLAWRLLKFQTTLPQFDPELSEETGYVGVPPVQQYHSATLPDAMKFMSGTQDPNKRMWTTDSPEGARRWGRGMTQGGPGGAVLGVRGKSPRGERLSPDWSDQPANELDALTIPGAELSPQDIVMQPLPTPPPARPMQNRYSDEEIAQEKARQQSAFDYLQQINSDPNISEEEKDAAMEDVSARFNLSEQFSQKPAFRYNPTTNAWEEDV